MENPSNFKIESNQPCSQLSKSKELLDFNSLCKFIKNLPYGRTKNKENPNAVLLEAKGTCSSKHAFLKQVAIENKQDNIKLFIGIYKMKEVNTKGVGKVLNNYNLKYIPEAHTYLKIGGKTLDITREITSSESFEDSLFKEYEILPNQIKDYKINKHQEFLKQWINTENIKIDVKQLWHIREQCIAALS